MRLKIINKYIGNLKIKDLKTIHIQNFYDDLDSGKISIYPKTVKTDKLAEIMKKNNYSGLKLESISNIAHSTIQRALKGLGIQKAKAEKIAEAFNKDIEDLFEIGYQKIYSPNTISSIRRLVHAILSLALKQQLIPKNYASREFIFSQKRPVKTDISCLDDIQAKKFANYLYNEEPDIRIKATFLLFLFTGIRKGELCGLEWQDIDFEKLTLSIVRTSINVSEKGLITKEPKTQGSARTISIPNTMISILKEFKQWQSDQELMYGDRWTKTKRLIIQHDGKPIFPDTINFWLDKTTAKAGIKKITVHSLRHTHITLMIINNMPLKTISARAGHARESTTSDIYSHFIPSSDMQIANKIEEVLITPKI